MTAFSHLKASVKPFIFTWYFICYIYHFNMVFHFPLHSCPKIFFCVSGIDNTPYPGLMVGVFPRIYTHIMKKSTSLKWQHEIITCSFRNRAKLSPIEKTWYLWWNNLNVWDFSIFQICKIFETQKISLTF